MIHSFEAANADVAWSEATKRLLAEGTMQPSRSGPMRELMRTALHIRDPRQRWVSSRREALNVAFALAEVFWILEGRNDSAFLNYFNRRLPEFAGRGPVYFGAYGERLRKRFGIDQMLRVASALKRKPSSRQAVMQIWDSTSDLPGDDGAEAAPDIPCNLTSMLKVRDGRLEWTQVMRSNDGYRGTPHNLVQFTSLQEVMSGWIGVEPGPYTHWSDSFHYYEKELDPSPIDTSIPSLPKNGDTLCLSLTEFNAMWPQMSRVAGLVPDEDNVTAMLLEKELHALSGPPGWVNILRVMGAEGLRRRKASTAAAAVMATVNNPVFTVLWDRWLGRIAGK